MHANAHADRNSWRLPPDETLQVADPKAKKAEVGDEEELALQDDEGHNWWSIVFALLVIGLVISGIVAAIFLIGYVDELLYWHGERMKLEQYLQGGLTPKRLPSSWISSSHFVFQADDGSLAVLDTDKNFNVSTLVTNHTLNQLIVKGYQCSKNFKYVLFQHNVKTVYRQSYTAHYTIYDVKKDHHIPVRLESSPKAQPERLQYVSWLGETNSLLIIFNNDIYYRSSPEDETDTRLTFTGEPNIIYNGIPDWLYQEDIFKNQAAIWPSNDGMLILYATFNDSDVGILNFPWFQTEPILTDAKTSSRTKLFPESKTVRYPTPGTPIPQVDLWIIDMMNISSLEYYRVIPPKALEGQDYYMTSAGWIGQKNSQISVVWLNRAQNLSIVSACLAPNWTCIESHTERALESSWLEIQEHPIFSPDGDSFLMLAHVQEGSRETYTHIKYITVTQQHIAVLSYGRHEVSKILAWDATSHLIWYLASEQHKPGQKHLYVSHDSTADDPKRLEVNCITCDLGEHLWSSRYLYGNCTYFNVLISPQNGTYHAPYYVLQCDGPGFPLAAIHNSTSHKLFKLLYDTRDVQESLFSDLAMPKRKSFEVPLPQGNIAEIQLLLPPSWREELRDAAYPVVVEVNGKPGSKAITEEFIVDWATFMSSHCDVVYVKLDVRGAKGQTNRALYHKLGGVEVQDQVSAIDYLLNKDHKYHKYLDKTRIGIWGWGYGGYVTAMVLGMGNQQKVFKCGIAVNPITDWFYYNAAFTERTLGFPTENFKAYVEADVTQRAKNIPRKSFFLLHGLADVTAPYQHSVLLSRALAQNNVLFRYQSYSNEDHELSGVLEHVYTSMQTFFEECLKLDTEEREQPSESEDT